MSQDLSLFITILAAVANTFEFVFHAFMPDRAQACAVAFMRDAFGPHPKEQQTAEKACRALALLFFFLAVFMWACVFAHLARVQ